MRLVVVMRKSSNSLFVILLSVFLFECSNNSCEQRIATEIHGKIVRKVWRDNKDVSAIYLESGKKTTIWSVYPVDWEFYKLVNVGDSIFKLENSRDIIVVRRKGDRTYTMQCGLTRNDPDL